MQLRWLLFLPLFAFYVLASQRPTPNQGTFVDQSLDEDEIAKLLRIRRQSSARIWIDEHTRSLQLGFEVSDLLVLIGVVVLSALQLAESISLDSLELWGSNAGALFTSFVSEPVLIGLLGTSAIGRLKFCSCLTAILKLVGLIASLTMLASWAMNPEVQLDEHIALTLTSSTAIFSAILVVGKIILAFEPIDDPIQQLYPIN